MKPSPTNLTSKNGVNEVSERVQPNKAHTETMRLKEKDGTYEITLQEVKRHKLTTEDELLPILARLASEAEAAVRNTSTGSLIGEKDAYLAFAERFLRYLKDDPKLFNDFLEEINKWPRVATPERQAGIR